MSSKHHSDGEDIPEFLRRPFTVADQARLDELGRAYEQSKERGTIGRARTTLEPTPDKLPDA